MLYIYEECIFVSFFSLWRDWNSVCTLKNETPINQSKSSFNLKQYDKDSNEIPIENHVKKVLTYILVLLSASEIRKKMSIMHVQQKLRLAWFILLKPNVFLLVKKYCLVNTKKHIWSTRKDVVGLNWFLVGSLTVPGQGRGPETKHMDWANGSRLGASLTHAV